MVESEKREEQKGEARKNGVAAKFLWNALDRIFFIAMGVVGTVATTYITGILKLNPPELKVVPSFSRIDAKKPVASEVGGLKLDYQKEAPRPYGVLRVDIANEGRGSAEKVRFQVKMPRTLGVAYEEEPDLKVYLPSTVTFTNNEFYAELGAFPSGARDYVAFRIEGDAGLLRDARVKLVNDEYEGEVSPIEGLK